MGLGFEPLGDGARIELHLGEDLAVGAEEDRRAAAARPADPTKLRFRLAARERLLPFGAVPLDGRDHLLRERGPHGSADAVEAAGMQIVLRLELSARVERRENELERGLAILLVNV